jgi:DNA polymerase-3 subunit alpha
MVERAADLGYPALGLTDHGNIAGSVQLYQEAIRRGIKPFPGSELYVVRDRTDKKAKRHHLGVLGYTTKGYENLVGLSTYTHRGFYNKPIIDLRELAELKAQGLTEGLAVMSGCYFGLVSQAVVAGQVDEAKTYLSCYQQWFDQVYVELQNHNIDHEDGWTDTLLADQLLLMAEEMSLPCVITQDSHYINPEEKDTHDALKRLVAFGPDADDAVFPGDGFHLADDNWIRLHHSGRRLQRGLEGLSDLLAAHQLRIPALDHYQYNIPFTVADPDKELEELCRGIINVNMYNERLDEELEVVKEARMAGYLLLVKEVTDHCREHGILTQTRGSAAGSLICWLLGITQVDPIKWGIPFDRFLSKDRTKPPDIDLDVEHVRRKELLEWLSSRFVVNQIGTWSEYSLSGSEDSGKGSLRVRYFSRRRKSGMPQLDWVDVPQNDKDVLYTLSDSGCLASYGTHAAGLVVTTTTADFDRLVPQQWIASSQTMVTQYEDKDIEALGLVKLDLLGSKTLTVLHKTMDNLGRDYRDGLEWIPLNDAATFRLLRKGDTDGIFQLEGGTARRGCRDLRPSSIDDVVAAMALFRPATMHSGATNAFIQRKHQLEATPDRHRIIAKHTSSTHGIMLFQEQVVSILRDLGFESEDLTKFLKAIKASNENIGDAGKVIEGYKALVLQLATQAGMTHGDQLWLWQAVEGFAEYGFNKAHSIVYGLTAYRCAYLVVTYPLEFHAALLSVAAEGTDRKKEAAYISATKRRDMRIMRAHVNHSDIGYSVDPAGRGIRRGLLGIKGIGEKAAREIVGARPGSGYRDLGQLAELVNHRKVTGIKPFRETGDMSIGTLNVLHEAGALDGL